ncbi:hypothetical protein [Candidatus Ichthyocystis sparus]|uniref:hypothetical protein n=2 Tax=Burkholderiales genera incertae sedis TaxID=224471 RepID=UPI000B8654F2|nr:hypothetical protein [Candidatus Ichthyocystis sparus]
MRDFSKNISSIKELFDLFDKWTLFAMFLYLSVSYPGVGMLIRDKSDISSLYCPSIIMALYEYYERLWEILLVIGGP